MVPPCLAVCASTDGCIFARGAIANYTFGASVRGWDMGHDTRFASDFARLVLVGARRGAGGTVCGRGEEDAVDVGEGVLDLVLGLLEGGLRTVSADRARVWIEDFVHGNRISDGCIVGSASLLEIAYWSEEKEDVVGGGVDGDVLPVVGCIASEGGVTER